MNRKIDDPEVSYVAIDNFKGAYEATEFLIHHGHKRILHLAGDLDVQCAHQRMEGFKAALEKNGIEAKNEHIAITHFSCREAREHLEKMFSEANFLISFLNDLCSSVSSKSILTLLYVIIRILM